MQRVCFYSETKQKQRYVAFKLKVVELLIDNIILFQTLDPCFYITSKI